MSSTDQAFRLLDLPSELLDGIASFQSKETLLDFRQTSKHIHRHTNVAFARCCFHTIQTDLSFASLRRLEQVAKNERYAQHVQSLLVKGRRHNHFGQGLKWGRDDQGHLLHRQPAVDRVRGILRSFPKCASFQFEKLLEDGDRVPEPLALGDVVNMILAIVVDLKRPLKGFEIHPLSSPDLSHPNTRGTDLDARTMAMVETSEFINLSSALQSFALGHQAGAGIHVATKFGIHLMQGAPKLRHLSLDGDHVARGMDIITRMMTAKLDFQLEDLSLAMATGLDGESFRTFLTLHCRNLKSLQLRYLDMEYEGWVPTIKHLATAGFTKLRSVELDRLSDSWKKDTLLVEFTGVKQDPIVDGWGETAKKIRYEQFRHVLGGARRVFCVSYDGPRMDVALQKIAASAKIGSNRFD